MRAALVCDGIVENIIIVSDESFDFGSRFEVILIDKKQVDIGATYDGKDFTNPVAPVNVPNSVSPRQMRRALNAFGLRDQIEQYVTTLSRDEQDDWEYGLTVERDSPVIEAGRRLLSMSVEQVDELFIYAASIE